MVNDDQHSEFIQSVEEEIKNERYRALWQKYGKIVVSSISVVLLLTAAYQYWNYRQEKMALLASQTFAQAQQFVEKEQYEQAISLLKPLSLDSTKIYENLARITIANTHAKNNQTSKAYPIYKQIIEGGDDFFAPIATIRLGYLFMNENSKELKAVAEKIEGFAKNTKHFVHDLACEFLGMYHLFNHDYSKALEVFVKIAQENNATPGMRMRARMISQAITSKEITHSQSVLGLLPDSVDIKDKKNQKTVSPSHPKTSQKKAPLKKKAK